jgi:hypothetical protein
VTETCWRWYILADPEGNEIRVAPPIAGHW